MRQDGRMRLAALLALLGVLVVGCGGDDAASCIELREPVDPLSDQHVLESGFAQYRTNPPTSGPHVAGPTPSGSLPNPLDPALQVRILEGGGVVIQYDDTLSEDEILDLRNRGRRDIVVAPAFGDMPGRIVVTAWTWKLTCSGIVDERIQTFIDTRPEDAPGWE